MSTKQMKNFEKITSTRYAVEEAIRLSKQPGSWEAKAPSMNIASWEEMAAEKRLSNVTDETNR